MSYEFFLGNRFRYPQDVSRTFTSTANHRMRKE